MRTAKGWKDGKMREQLHIWFAYTTILLSLAMLAACSSNEAITAPIISGTATHNTATTISYENKINAPPSNRQGLHMYVAPGSVTPTGLRLSMINNTRQTYGHGVMFCIEQYENGRWTPAPAITEYFNWIYPLLTVHPNTTVEENISWKHMHGQLPPGKYRIVRSFIDITYEPIWSLEREINLYAIFTVKEDNQAAYLQWQSQEVHHAAIAYARLEGLDLEILEHSPRGLSFTLTNNNPHYSYIIDKVFVGWDSTFPDGGPGTTEYSIHPGTTSWPFGDNKLLHPGDYISSEVDWYYRRRNLTPSWRRRNYEPNIFELVVVVTMDVSDEYVSTFSRHIIPGLPHTTHRLRAQFDI